MAALTSRENVVKLFFFLQVGSYCFVVICIKEVILIIQIAVGDLKEADLL